MTYLLNAATSSRQHISHSFHTIIEIHHYIISIQLINGCCIIIVFTWKWSRNVALIVATMRSSLFAIRYWYCTNSFKELDSQWLKNISSSRTGYINTLIAARWTVWGIQRMRAFCAENGMPCSLHCRSSDVINVLLLLALSITIAITYE